MTLKGLSDYFQKEEQAVRVSLIVLAVVWVVYFVGFLPLDSRVSDAKRLIGEKMALLAQVQSRLTKKRIERDKFKELGVAIEEGKLPRIKLRLYKGDILSFISNTAGNCGVRLGSIKPELGKKGISISISGTANYYAFMKFLLKLKHSEYVVLVKQLSIKKVRKGIDFQLFLVIYGEVK
ncbi:MAG: hypothetical protein J7L41_05495 [Synergistetes bacterium]|nr:hypothetical protein [Synergistota bacterium]